MPLELAQDEQIKAAGIMYVCDGEILLMKRAQGDAEGCWAFPGGKIEGDETPQEAALRESLEETGFAAKEGLKQISLSKSPLVEFTTFMARADKFTPVIDAEHSEYGWFKMSELPSPMHPGVADTLQNYSSGMDSARQEDMNGYVSIERNPISRSGVFKYLGKSIGAPEPDRIYNVYRPEEELNNADAIASFKMIPLIDDHTMLGSKEQGYTAPEDKGIHGITGEEVVFENGVLYSNLKIFSQRLYDMVQQGKNNLSLGYRCIYEKASGVFNGESYEYVQRKLRGNHLALVDEARCAVAVLDHHITFDHFDLTLQKGEDKMTEEELKAKDAADKKAKDESEAAEKKAAEDKKAKDESEAKEKKDAEDKAAKDAEEAKEKEKEKEKKDGMDSAELKRVSTELAALKQNGFKQIMGEVKQRDALATDVSKHVGTFDHSDMTLDEVAAYGVKKLGLTAAAGEEKAVLAGYLQGAKVSSTGFALDAKTKSSEVDAYLTPKN